jgi:cytochrome c biogenesis protein CcmG, thiol:disulfide interchange protein DsbE
MYSKNPIKIILRLLSVFTVIFLASYSNASEKKVKAPDFTLVDISGKSVSLSQYLGKIVIIDFWATWCPPCRMSIPELVQLQNKYREKGLVILGISFDSADTKNDYLSAFKEKYKINYTVLRADDKTTEKYFGGSQIDIPTLFIIDRGGMVVDMHSGYSPGAVEKSLIKIFQ